MWYFLFCESLLRLPHAYMLLWTVSMPARSFTNWNKACDKRLAHLTSYINQTKHHRLNCACDARTCLELHVIGLCCIHSLLTTRAWHLPHRTKDTDAWSIFRVEFFPASRRFRCGEVSTFDGAAVAATSLDDVSVLMTIEKAVLHTLPLRVCARGHLQISSHIPLSLGLQHFSNNFFWAQLMRPAARCGSGLSATFLLSGVIMVVNLWWSDITGSGVLDLIRLAARGITILSPVEVHGSSLGSPAFGA